jgi:hypothetical protein
MTIDAEEYPAELVEIFCVEWRRSHSFHIFGRPKVYDQDIPPVNKEIRSLKVVVVDPFVVDELQGCNETARRFLEYLTLHLSSLSFSSRLSRF